MADEKTPDVSEIFGGVLAWLVIIAVGYWFFAEDDIDDVAQSAIEAALDGDADDLTELNAQYIDWGGRFNLWLAGDDLSPYYEDIGIFDVLFGSAMLNSALESNSEYGVRNFENRVEYHDGWDDVEIIAYGSKELPLPEQSFWEWIVSFFADGPYEPIVDEAGAAVAKVTYDDDAVEFYLLPLAHIDESEFTREGWAIKSWSLIKAFAADRDNDDEINKLEEKLIEKYEKAFDD